LYLYLGYYDDDEFVERSVFSSMPKIKNKKKISFRFQPKGKSKASFLYVRKYFPESWIWLNINNNGCVWVFYFF